MKLPPPQAPPSDIVTYADALEDECVSDPNRAAWESSKQRWLDLYTGNHFCDPLVSAAVAAAKLEPEQVNAARHSLHSALKLVYNRVMNAVLAMLAGQISNPPKVVFAARENGEPPIYYLNGFVQNPALQQIAMLAGMADPQVQELDAIYGRQQVAVQPQQQPQQPPQMDTAADTEASAAAAPVGMEAGSVAQPPQIQEQLHPETAQAAQHVGQSIPLTPQLADQVKMLIDQGKIMTAQARLAGMPPPLGLVPPEALVEITDQTTAQFTQTVFDGLWEQCGGIEATAESILNKKVLGWQPTLFESDRTKIAYGDSPITLTNVEGAYVFFDPATSSFRPPRYVIMLEPVTYEEAVAKYPDLNIPAFKDKFQSGPLTARNANRANSRLFNLDSKRDRAIIRTLWHRDWPYPMDPDEALTCGMVTMGQVPTGETTQPPPDLGAMEQGVPPAPAQPVMRQAMLLADTGEETNPQAANWPIIYAWREIRDIEGEILFDRRCKLPIAPVVNNINIPIPFSPYGLGEPDRLEGLQMAINHVLSDLVEHQRRLAFPIEVRHQTVADALGGVLARKQRMRPGTPINVPRDIAQDVGGDLTKLFQYVQMPPMSADAWKLLEFLVEAIDKEANNTDIQQGIAPSGSSGAWVQSLQAAAQQVAQVTSQSTEAWLKKLVRLFVDFIANDMTEQDVARYSSKYPPAIVAAFKRKQKQLYIDISVEIQSGSAAAKQGQTNALIAAKQGGAMVSDPELLNRLGVDPDDQLQQQASWNQKLIESGLIQQQAERDAAAGPANNGNAKTEKQGNSA